MSLISIKSNTIYWEIARGTSAEIALNKPDGWDIYDQIVMDLKPEKDIQSFSMLRLTPGAGLLIEGNRLIVSLTYQQTTVLRGKQIHADIKLRIGSEVIPPIPFLITVKDTVTKL